MMPIRRRSSCTSIPRKLIFHSRRWVAWILAWLMATLAIGTTPVRAQRSNDVPPVFDVHLHAAFTPATVTAMRRAMDSLNVRHAMYIGAYDQLRTLPDSTPGRYLPGLMFPCAGGLMPNVGVPCFPGASMFPDTAWLRREVKAGNIRVFGEISAQYLGIAPNDARMEPYWGLAEELQVPVGIHLGIGPPGVAYAASPFPVFKSPTYRGAVGDPYLLEDVLVRHPKLRMYVMHAAWPEITHLLYMMCMHPGLYADLSVLQYAIARPAYLSALRTLTDAGLSKRLMFGSDGGPRFLAEGIAAINSADFLNESQKRDILFNNAVRFFQTADVPALPFSRTCGG